MAYPISPDPMINAWGGLNGVDVFSDTATHTGDWVKIVAKGATVINAITSTWSSNPTNLEDGEALYGKFTSIDLTSGTVYCYRSALAQS